MASGAWPDRRTDRVDRRSGDARATRSRPTAGPPSCSTDLERQTEGRDKTGVFTGAFATNPVTGEAIPVFVADYVLMGYGTGAIMAVPGQDERDWEFATRFGLPIVRTVQPPDGLGGRGVHRRRARRSTRPTTRSAWTAWASTTRRRAIIEWLEQHGHRRGARSPTSCATGCSAASATGASRSRSSTTSTTCRSRCPTRCCRSSCPRSTTTRRKTFAEDDTDSEPEPPLARKADWVEVTLDLGDGPKPYRRETNTMPQWAGSCWYELRYLDPTNTERFVDPEVERYWMGPQGDGHTGGVDLYVGGVEHAVLHLLYARFWHKVLFDLGHVSSSEPFHRLFNQGMIQAYAYTDERGGYVPAAEVVRGSATAAAFTYEGKPVTREYGKIGKSLKNMVTPDEMYDAYGADTFRVYEMSMGPLDVSRPWETRAVVGSQRFLQRLWRNVVDEETGELRRRRRAGGRRDPAAAAPHDRRRARRHGRAARSTPPSRG